LYLALHASAVTHTAPAVADVSIFEAVVKLIFPAENRMAEIAEWISVLALLLDVGLFYRDSAKVVISTLLRVVAQFPLTENHCHYL
jgi:hypothetical protein